MNHVQYVKAHKDEFSKYIWDDSEHHKTLPAMTMLNYMMRYSKEFFLYVKRVEAIDSLLNV